MGTPAASDVIAITGTGLSEAIVTALIGDAALLASGSACFTAYSDERQTAIVKWIAAHFVACTDAGGVGVTSDKIGDAARTYARPGGAGQGLGSTSYGQAALALDTEGCLARIGQPRSSLEVL